MYSQIHVFSSISVEMSVLDLMSKILSDLFIPKKSTYENKLVSA